jgi:uroporphyrinogen III methyltransferase/synthase
VTVYLVGAGPGDPGLLTLRGAEVLGRADVVVHDRLAEPSLLSLASPNARLVDVGKTPGSPVDQREINALLVAEGAAGRCVVRLKGGDPYVFGRGGEEARALREAGIAFEVVPGVTSAVAAPAYAGVPLTHRSLSTSFTVVTGHSRAAVDEETNWEALAAAGGTIVVLMGVAHRGAIAQRLIAGGLDPATPVMAVRWGTRPEQRSLRCRLDCLGATPLEPPATIVIGAVAGLDLGWYEGLPLFGRTVVVTRARPQAAELSARLRELGARPVEVPLIAIEAPTDGGAALRIAAQQLAAGAYEWVVFSSPNAVEALLYCMRDARAFGGALVAAIGPGTAERLRDRGVVADLVPRRSIAEGLVEEMPVVAAETAKVGGRILIPRASRGRDVLEKGLAARGWKVDVVEAYRTTLIAAGEQQRSAVAAADAVLFTSSSTVTAFVESFKGELEPTPAVVCIGPATARTAAEAGLRVDAVADPHTIDGLLAALVDLLAGDTLER